MNDQYKSQIIEFITNSLGAMSSEHPDLSRLIQIDSQNPALGFNILPDQKIQERPFAYEFYHQMRKKEQEFLKLFRGCVVQGEVSKRYQKILHLKKCPDFIIHRKNSVDPEDQLVVLEFKLSSNPNLEADLEKLADFKLHLAYQIAAEVLIGTTGENEEALESGRESAEKSNGGNTLQIDVITYDTTDGIARHADRINFKR